MRFLSLSLVVLASAASTILAAEEELKIDVTHAVDCDRKSAKGDTINVHYRGTLQKDGSEFDASYNRGQPFSFKLGGGMVIKGWDQGLLDMCIGEKRTLTVPPKFGYGERSMGPIPAGSTLVFETELIGIQGYEPPAEGVASKIKEMAGDAAEALKVTLQDTDGDGQEHNEL